MDVFARAHAAHATALIYPRDYTLIEAPLPGDARHAGRRRRPIMAVGGEAVHRWIPHFRGRLADAVHPEGGGGPERHAVPGGARARSSRRTGPALVDFFEDYDPGDRAGTWTRPIIPRWSSWSRSSPRCRPSSCSGSSPSATSIATATRCPIWRRSSAASTGSQEFNFIKADLDVSKHADLSIIQELAAGIK